jgi:hypothetical protein
MSTGVVMLYLFSEISSVDIQLPCEYGKAGNGHYNGMA